MTQTSELLAAVARIVHADRAHPGERCVHPCAGTTDEDWSLARRVATALVEMDDGTCGLCGHTQGKHRHDHPATSKRAAATINLRNKQAAHWQILMALYNHPQTDEEIQHSLRMNPNSERPRRVELVEKGLVEACHPTKHTESGREAMLWELTDAGYSAVEAEMRAMTAREAS